MANETTDNLDEGQRGELTAEKVAQAQEALENDERGEAKKLLAQALKIDPTDIAALELLGDIFLEDAEQEKAVQVFAHGKKHHPDYEPFEEKLAQAHLDIAEMERDRQLMHDAIELGSVGDKILDRKASLASGLSAFVPGAGQVYNDQWEKAAAFFAVALMFLLLWINMLFSQMRSIQDEAKAGVYRRYMPTINQAIDSMDSAQRTFFWLMVTSWIVTVTVSAVEAGLSAHRLNEDRRRHLGI